LNTRLKTFGAEYRDNTDFDYIDEEKNQPAGPALLHVLGIAICT
jgi:hypothetical protein